MCVQITPSRGKRIIKGFACDLLEVFVTLHRSETEREFKLFLSPYLRDTLSVIRNIVFELLPDTNWVYQRTIHIESKRFGYRHYLSPSTDPDAGGDHRYSPHGRWSSTASGI